MKRKDLKIKNSRKAVGPTKFIRIEAKIAVTPASCTPDLAMALLKNGLLLEMLGYVVETPHSKTMFKVIKDANRKVIGELIVSLNSEGDV